MAAKKETNTTVLERTYNVPLRKEYQKAPNWKRTGKAVVALKEFIERHMKSENVKLEKEVNEELWKHGIKNPPHHLKVNATKNDKGDVRVSLFGTKKEAATPAKEEKKTDPAAKK